MGNPPYGWPAVYPSPKALFISDTPTVVFAGPCRLLNVSGKLDSPAGNRRTHFYDLGNNTGLTATASAPLLKLSLNQDSGNNIQLQGLPFPNGLVYDVTGSVTDYWCTILYVPDSQL